VIKLKEGDAVASIARLESKPAISKSAKNENDSKVEQLALIENEGENKKRRGNSKK
jgi:hypothetical protein